MSDIFDSAISKGRGLDARRQNHAATIHYLDDNGNIRNLFAESSQLNEKFYTDERPAAILVTEDGQDAYDLFVQLIAGAPCPDGTKYWEDEKRMKTYRLKARLEKSTETTTRLETHLDDVRQQKADLDSTKQQLCDRLSAIDELQVKLVDEKETVYHQIEQLSTKYSQLVALEKKLAQQFRKEHQTRIQALVQLHNS